MENTFELPPCSPAPLADDAALPSLLSAEDATPFPLAVGCQVRIKDIVARPEINGCTGIIIGQFNHEKLRWPVEVMLKTGDGFCLNLFFLRLKLSLTFPQAAQRTAN
jgi:hypothetical protein